MKEKVRKYSYMYECIEAFSVPYFDIETDSYDENRRIDIEVGSIWEHEYVIITYTGVEVHLSNKNDIWIELSEERLNKSFKLMGVV